MCIVYIYIYFHLDEGIWATSQVDSGINLPIHIGT